MKEFLIIAFSFIAIVGLARLLFEIFPILGQWFDNATGVLLWD